MGKAPKKQKYKLDSKKFDGPQEKIKKEKDVDGEDIFKEMLRMKTHRR